MASWALVEELFERGDAAFSASLRQIHHADRLGAFASKWFADKRPFARGAMVEYLEGPLDAYRHEALVKRLYKLAEAAGDDEVVGAFLVAFDRCIRMKEKKRFEYKSDSFPDFESAENAIALWAAEGFESRFCNEWRGRVYASAVRTSSHAANGAPTMFRPGPNARKGDSSLHPFQERSIRKRGLRLFTPATRRYLRRRAWRYFRKLGSSAPDRFVRAASAFLARYEDRDVATEMNFLDNWGLVHALFHGSPVIVRSPMGCCVAEGCALADAKFAPWLEAAWARHPETAYDLLRSARSRPVRSFAAWILREKCGGWLSRLPARTLLELVDHAEEDVSSLGFDALESARDLADVPISEWLRRLEGDDLWKLERLSALLGSRLRADHISVDQMLALARNRSLPVARLGLRLTRSRGWTAPDAAQLLTLCNAECEALRTEVAEWLRPTLDSFGPPRPEWLMEFLDSRFEQFRTVGFDWLRETSLWDDPQLWIRLLESPYDDVRRRMSDRAPLLLAEAPPDSLRWLWAGVVGRVYGLSRSKTATAMQVVARMKAKPEEVDSLLPLLRLALRSVRGPEFRAGLAAAVELAEHRPDLRGRMKSEVPELEFV